MILTRTQSRQIITITVVAAGLFLTMRLLPTGTNLSHMDFRVEGENVIQFCDPANPQFLPVIAVRSPVSIKVATESAAVSGKPVALRLTLKTAGGKPIGPEDLLVVHTQPLHLMIVNPDLGEYHHVHPQPGDADGDWLLQFVPRGSGTYRIFADFTPAATGLGLYASADVEIGAGAPAPLPDAEFASTSAGSGTGDDLERWTEQSGYEFMLHTDRPIRAGEQADLAFTVRSRDGGVVPLRPVMDAFAHLVAFDRDRTGFAHIHPAETDLSDPPDAKNPRLTFKVTIPIAGRYVIWAQVNLDGTETYVPFWFNVGA